MTVHINRINSPHGELDDKVVRFSQRVWQGFTASELGGGCSIEEASHQIERRIRYTRYGLSEDCPGGFASTPTVFEFHGTEFTTPLLTSFPYDPEPICRSIFNGYPVAVGVGVDARWRRERYREKSVIPILSLGERITDGIALLLDGWDDRAGAFTFIDGEYSGSEVAHKGLISYSHVMNSRMCFELVGVDFTKL